MPAANPSSTERPERLAADVDERAPSGNGREPTLLERAGAAAAGVGGVASHGSRRQKVIQAIVATLIVAFLVAFLATQWNQLPDFEWRFRPGWLGLSLVAVAAFYVLQGEIWRHIVGGLGQRIDGRNGRAVWGKSLVARYVPTNALMVVGRVVMAERHGVKRRVCLASMVYELGLALATAVMVGAYFAITLPALEDQPARYALLAVIPLALVGLHPRVFGPLANFALRKLGRESLPATLSFTRIVLYSAAFLLVWATIGVGVFAFTSALHPVNAGDFAYIAASYPVAFCVAVLTFVVPGGLGTRDAALATALSAVLPVAVATAIAVAFRLAQTAVELAYVGAVTLVARRDRIPTRSRR